MKGTFFNKPLEWNIETQGEAWTQGNPVIGTLKVTNHGSESIALTDAGVGLAYADIKKVHAKDEKALKFDLKQNFEKSELAAAASLELSFQLTLPENCSVSDKKASYYLAYGRNFNESHLQLKVEPRALFGKIVGLLDTFQRFKVKEFKGSKNGVEYKLLPPTSREMANIDSLLLNFSMEGNDLQMNFDFQVKKLDTSSITTKLNKESAKIKKT